MKTLLLIATLFSIASAYSQCNIEEVKTSEFTKIFAANEFLYKNEDLENGLQIVAGGISFLVNVKNAKDYVPTLEMRYAFSGDKPEIVPRQVQFIMNDNSTIVLNAKTMDVTNVKSLKVRICTFLLLPHELIALKATPLKTITVLDTRTGDKLIVSPYPKLFEEQIECVEDHRSNLK